MTKIRLKGRDIPLVYTVLDMKALQEEIGPLGELYGRILGINQEDKKDTSRWGSPEHLAALGKAIRILGNSGLEEAGENPDLTDRWVMRAIRPGQINEAGGACIQAMNEGTDSEIPEENDGQPVDVTLEEMNKKKERDG